MNKNDKRVEKSTENAVFFSGKYVEMRLIFPINQM